MGQQARPARKAEGPLAFSGAQMTLVLEPESAGGGQEAAALCQSPQPPASLARLPTARAGSPPPGWPRHHGDTGGRWSADQLTPAPARLHLSHLALPCPSRSEGLKEGAVSWWPRERVSIAKVLPARTARSSPVGKQRGCLACCLEGGRTREPWVLVRGC